MSSGFSWESGSKRYEKKKKKLWYRGVYALKRKYTLGIDELGENWVVRVTMITITMVVTMMEAREKEKKDGAMRVGTVAR